MHDFLQMLAYHSTQQKNDALPPGIAHTIHKAMASTESNGAPSMFAISSYVIHCMLELSVRPDETIMGFWLDSATVEAEARFSVPYVVCVCVCVCVCVSLCFLPFLLCVYLLIC